MLTETLVAAPKPDDKVRRAKERKPKRGIFEKVSGSDVWWIRYVDGQGRYRREKAGSWGNADKLLIKRRNEALQGKKLPETLRKASVSFSEIAGDALEYSRTTKVRDAYRIDSWHMETILVWFRERRATEIMPQDVERRLNEIADQGRKPATVNRYRALLSLVFSLAVRNGKLETNPVRQVKRRKENNERVRFLDEAEEASLRAKITELYPDCEPEFDLALHSGMRRGEQYRLRWQDVDVKNRIITIERSKTGEARRVHINSVAQKALNKLRKRSGGIGYVCAGSQRPRSRDWRRWFEDAVKKAKIADFRWHDLRHTFASRLVITGVPLRAVQTLLGHKRIETTLRYSHLGDTQLREAVERIAGKPTDTPVAPGAKRSRRARIAKSA